MKKSEAFPSSIIQPDNIEALTLTIKKVELETYKYDGEERRKGPPCTSRRQKRSPR